MAEVSLQFLAAQMQRMLEGLNDVRSGLDVIDSRLLDLDGRLRQQADENTVLSGLVFRHAGEHIAWGGVQNELKRIRARLDALESRPS